MTHAPQEELGHANVICAQKVCYHNKGTQGTKNYLRAQEDPGMTHDTVGAVFTKKVHGTQKKVSARSKKDHPDVPCAMYGRGVTKTMQTRAYET